MDGGEKEIPLRLVERHRFHLSYERDRDYTGDCSETEIQRGRVKRQTFHWVWQGDKD